MKTTKTVILVAFFLEVAFAQPLITQQPDAGSYITIPQNSSTIIYACPVGNCVPPASVTVNSFYSRQGPPNGCTEQFNNGPYAGFMNVYIVCGSSAVPGTYQYTLNACDTKGCSSRGYSITIH